MKIPPRKPAPIAKSLASGATKKKAAVKATGHTAASTFEGVKKAALSMKRSGPVRRELSRDFIGIKRGLRTGDDAAVKSGVASVANRLKVQLPDLASLTGWGAFGALGAKLGHVMVDVTKFNRVDYRHVMHLARAAGGKINDPDPSNGHLL